MNSKTRRILDLLAQGRITADEAEQLLGAMGAAPPEPARPIGAGPSPSNAPPPRFFRISVVEVAENGERAERVNMRIPLTIIRSGVRLGALMPGFLGEQVSARLREKGIDLNFAKLDQRQLDAILADLGELSVDVDGGRSKVRITCE